MSFRSHCEGGLGGTKDLVKPSENLGRKPRETRSDGASHS